MNPIRSAWDIYIGIPFNITSLALRACGRSLTLSLAISYLDRLAGLLPEARRPQFYLVILNAKYSPPELRDWAERQLTADSVPR